MSFLYTFNHAATTNFLKNKEVFDKNNQATYRLIGLCPATFHTSESVVLQNKEDGNTLHMCIDENWEMMELRTARRGTLIYIEGVDSVGKATQTNLLRKRLEQHGHKVKTSTYPNYEAEYGKLVKAYLNGKFGEASQVDAKLAGSLYTLDRLAQKEELEDYLEQGYVVITDRSPYSNAAFQGTKAPTFVAQKQIFDWFEHAEFELLGLPKPDMVILLCGEPEETTKLMEKRNAKASVAKGGGKDQHESNMKMLNDAYELYVSASYSRYWPCVSVLNDKGFKSVEGIAETVYTHVKNAIK